MLCYGSPNKLTHVALELKNLPTVQETQETRVWSLSGRFPGGGNGNQLQCSCLENSIDRGAWWATVHGVTKSQTWLNDWVCTHAHTHTQQINAVVKKWWLLKNLFIWLPWVLVEASEHLTCGMWDLVPWPGVEPETPSLGAWSLSLWPQGKSRLLILITVIKCQVLH